MDKKYRLTWPQESIYLTEKHYELASVNNLGVDLVFKNNFIPRILRKAVYMTLERYDVFKTRIDSSENGIQRYDENAIKNFKVPIAYFKSKKEIDKYIENSVNEEFNISENVVRIGIYTSKVKKNGLMYSVHHIINDGYSVYITFNTIMKTYEFLLKIYTILMNNTNNSKHLFKELTPDYINDLKSEDYNNIIESIKLKHKYYDNLSIYFSNKKEISKNKIKLISENNSTEYENLLKILELQKNGNNKNGKDDKGNYTKEEIIDLIESISFEELLDAYEIYNNREFKEKLEKTAEDIKTHFKENKEIENSILNKRKLSRLNTIKIKEMADIPKYIDFLKKEIGYQKSGRFKEDEKYWQNQISLSPKIISLSKKENIYLQERKIKEREILEAGRTQFSLSKEYLDLVFKYCEKHKITPYTYFMSIYTLYISNISMENNFSIGTTILNRSNYRERQTPGMFVSTLPYITDIDSNITALEYMGVVKRDLLKILRHQKYPYNLILKHSKETQKTSSNLYTALISYQLTNHDKTNIKVENYQPHWIHSKYNANELDIHIYDVRGENKFAIAYDYQLKAFTEKDIIEHHNRMIEMSTQILKNEKIKISDLEVATKEERKYILTTYNNKKYMDMHWGYGSDKEKKSIQNNIVKEILLNYFDKKILNKKAVIDETKDKSLTYKDLYEKIYLKYLEFQNLGIKQGDRIVIISNPSIDFLINILAINMCRAIFIPVDIEYPLNRIKYIINDSNAKKLITPESFNVAELEKDLDILKIETENLLKEEQIKKHKMAFLFRKCITSLNKSGYEPAYIIYTSGSTSNPKGVVINNKSLYKYINWSKEEYVNKNNDESALLKINGKGNMPFYSSISFDLTITSIFLPIYSKSTMYIYHDENIHNVLERIILNPEINIFKLTPAHLKLVNRFKKSILSKSNITKMIVGGDILPNVLCREIISKNNKIQILNEYGPTETTVGIMKHIYNKEDKKYASNPIGVPAKESIIYLVNQYGKILPPGVRGEMLIETKAIFDEYINLEEKTNDVRVDSKYTNNKAYLTGDIAVIHKDDNIMEYIGRKDFQVNINGYRIDLGEITAQVLNHPDILECYVRDINLNEDSEKKNIVERKMLAVYYVLKDEAIGKEKKEIFEEELKNYLKKYLPYYMIPEIYILTDKIPLTINGKIDKNKLPEYSKKDVKVIQAKTKLQKEILKAMIESLDKTVNLKTEDISIRESIFKYGLDSLDIIAFQLELAKEGIEISMQKIYDLQTIEKIEKHILKNISLKESLESIEASIKEGEIDETMYNSPLYEWYEGYRDISKYKEELPDSKKISLYEHIANKSNKIKDLDEEDNNVAVCIFGVTGFLGIHILKEYLVNTNFKIKVLMRKKNFASVENRLLSNWNYYFNNKKRKEGIKLPLSNFIDRIEFYEGDITKDKFGLKKNEYEKFGEKAKLIISTAAVVKHFGLESLFYNTNVNGTKNIIDFSHDFNIPLNYISTLSVSGQGLVKTEPALFDESKLYIDQRFKDNIYIKTKFEAEKSIIDAVKEKNIMATIIRVGNITNREEDYVFQENIKENAFMNRIQVMLELKKFPKEMLNLPAEFIPVDRLAYIIFQISLEKKRYLDVYHLSNVQNVNMKRLMKNAIELGVKIEESNLVEFLKIIEKDSKKYYGIKNYIKHFNDMDLENLVEISSSQTDYFLSERSLMFNTVNDDYIKGVIKYLFNNDD